MPRWNKLGAPPTAPTGGGGPSPAAAAATAAATAAFFWAVATAAAAAATRCRNRLCPNEGCRMLSMEKGSGGTGGAGLWCSCCCCCCCCCCCSCGLLSLGGGLPSPTLLPLVLCPPLPPPSPPTIGKGFELGKNGWKSRMDAGGEKAEVFGHGSSFGSGGGGGENEGWEGGDLTSEEEGSAEWLS